MMTERVSLQRISSLMESFGLKHSSKALADLLEKASAEDLTHREFLLSLLDTELKGRYERRRARSYAAAHFPINPRYIDEFDSTELESGITEGQLHQLKELTWIDARNNLIFVGSPGLGKTMITVGLGIHAIDAGYTVVFEKMINLIKLFDNDGKERNATFRLRNIRKAQLIIIDEIGYTPINREQANKFFNFVSDCYERCSIAFTTNKPISEWSEVIGDPILTTALLDRILHHSRCFSLKGTSYRLKHPDMFYGTDKESYIGSNTKSTNQ